MNRVRWIDIIKGLCITLVVISHITGIPFLGKYLFAPYVTVFYFLSGAVFKPNNLTIKCRIYRRIKKLLFSYLKYSLIVSAYIYVIYIFKGEFSTKLFFGNVFGLLYSRHSVVPFGIAFLNDINSTFWFITSLVTSYIFFELLLYFDSKCKIEIIIAFSVFITILFESIPFLLPWSIDTAPFGGLMMYIGYKIYQTNIIKDELIINKKAAFRIVWVIIVYVILCNANSGSNFSIKNYGRLPFGLNCVVFLVISVLGTVLYIIIAKYVESRKYISKLLMYLGQNSLHILCLHLLVIHIYYSIFNSFNIVPSGVSYWINVVICTLTAIIIPLLYGKLEELCKEKIHVRYKKTSYQK